MEDEVLELSLHTVDKRLTVLEHDMKNVRQGMTGIYMKMDKLTSTIVQVGMAVIAAIIMLLISVIGYFMVQKDTQLDEIRKMAAQVEANSRMQDRHQAPQDVTVHD